MKKFVSVVLALAMVLSLAISSAAAVEISVDGTTVIVGSEVSSVAPRYSGHTVFRITKAANDPLDTTFRCLSKYGNKCDVTIVNDSGSDLVVEMFDGEYAEIVTAYGSTVIPIATTDGSPLQVTVDIQVEALGNPSGTYTVTAVQYNA